jgi:DNA-directed RNA polymerase specialized sigma24 family protein
VLRFWLDLPLAEVAEAMGTRVGTAKAHVSRALATVTGALSGSDEHPRRTP